MMVLTIARLVLASSALARARAALSPLERPTIGVLTFPVDDNATAGPSTVDAAYVERGALSLERRGRAGTGGPRRAPVREARGGGGGGARPSRRYVKWLEQAGAAVVPILYNSTPPTLEAQFETLNGVLFTGGPKRPTDFPRVRACVRSWRRARRALLQLSTYWQTNSVAAVSVPARCVSAAHERAREAT